jgi:hypothetical protein
MVAWVESHSVGGIAVLVFGASSLLAASILAIVVAAARLPSVAATFKATTPTMLTPLSLIAGLLIAFLAARVWANVDHANGLVAQEGSAVHEAVRLADMLGGEAGAALRDAALRYHRFVVVEDFPAMASGRASAREPGILVEAMGVLLGAAPASPGGRLAQERAVTALELAMDARRRRVLLSRAAIAPLQWFAVMLLAGLILVVIAVVHADRRAAAALNMGIFATAFAACLLLLMAHDGPFAAGGFTVRPYPLHEIGVEPTPPGSAARAP